MNVTGHSRIPVLAAVLTAALLAVAPPALLAATWVGSGGGVWTEPDSDGDWSPSYNSGDSVTFDDTAAGTTSIVLGGTLAPGSVIVNNTNKAYVFNSGAITGATSLTKSGPGMLTMSCTNFYSGGTTISGNGGTLILSGGLATNVSSFTLSSANNQLIITNNKVFFSGGLYVGNDPGSTNNTVMVSGGSQVNFISGDLFLGNNNSANAGIGLIISGAGSVVSNIGSSWGLTLARRGGSGCYLTVTNGGQAWISSVCLDLSSGPRASSNTVTVTGLGSLLSVNGLVSKIGLSSTNFGNVLRVDSGGIVTNTYVQMGGPGSSGNSLVLTNGGQFFGNNHANWIGYSANANSNSAYVGGASGSTNALWNLGGNTLLVGAAASTGNYMTVATGGIVTNFSTLTVGQDDTASSNVLSVSGGMLSGGTVAVTTNNFFAVSRGGVIMVTNINLFATGSVFTVDGGMLVSRTNGNLVSGTGGMTLGVNGMTNDTSFYSVTNPASMDGAGGLTKLGAGTLTLSGTNTYAGVTIISNGVLSLTHQLCLGTNTDVYISAGATNNLAFIGTQTVHVVCINGIVQQAGLYGASKMPGSFSGAGYLMTVWPPPGGTVIAVR